jgi:hypothetical protein
MKHSVTFFIHLFCITTINCAEISTKKIPASDLQLIQNLQRRDFRIFLDTKKYGTEAAQIAKEDGAVIANCLSKYPIEILYDEREITGNLPLYTACAFNHPRIVEYMISRGLPPSKTIERSCITASARIAAERRHHDSLSLLIPHLTGEEIIEKQKGTNDSIFSLTFDSGNDRLLWSLLQRNIPSDFFIEKPTWLFKALNKEEKVFDHISRMLFLFCGPERRHHFKSIDIFLAKFPLTNEAFKKIAYTETSSRCLLLQEIRAEIDRYYQVG